MSTLTAAQPHAPTFDIRALIRRRPVTAYLLMAFACFWLSLLPVLFLNAPMYAATTLTLALPAVLVTAITDGRAGVRDLIGRALRWRVGPHWYALALLGLPIGMMLIAGTFLGVAPLAVIGDKWALLLTVFAPKVLLALIAVQLCEEIGWTGFVQQRLQDRHGALRASLMVAPAFALIHFPANLVGAPITGESALKALVLLIPTALFAVFFRPLLTWLYNGAGRSVLIVALLHAVLNTVSNTAFAAEFVPESAAMWLPLAVVAVLAVLAAIATRGQLGYRPVEATPGGPSRR